MSEVEKLIATARGEVINYNCGQSNLSPDQARAFRDLATALEGLMGERDEARGDLALVEAEWRWKFSAYQIADAQLCQVISLWSENPGDGEIPEMLRVARLNLRRADNDAEARAERAEAEIARRDAVAAEAWGDQRDEYSDAIAAAHPMRTQDHDTFAKALAMVGKRHGKYELVGLVNWLLAELEKLRNHMVSSADIAAAGPAAGAATGLHSQSEGEPS